MTPHLSAEQLQGLLEEIARGLAPVLDAQVRAQRKPATKFLEDAAAEFQEQALARERQARQALSVRREHCLSPQVQEEQCRYALDYFLPRHEGVRRAYAQLLELRPQFSFTLEELRSTLKAAGAEQAAVLREVLDALAKAGVDPSSRGFEAAIVKAYDDAFDRALERVLARRGRGAVAGRLAFQAHLSLAAQFVAPQLRLAESAREDLCVGAPRAHTAACAKTDWSRCCSALRSATRSARRQRASANSLCR
jgi:hypothetical protein